MIRRILDTLLEADSQPGDWYAWATNQAGHGALVGAPLAMALLASGLPEVLVAGVSGLLHYLVWEVSIQHGKDRADSLTDSAHVGAGAALLTAALCWGLAAAALAFLAWGGMLAVGIYSRLAPPRA